jgi:hypothetical protein
LLNLLKCFGHKVSYKRDYKTWKSLCNCTRKWGSIDWIKAIREIPGIKFKRDYRPTIGKIKKALTKGPVLVSCTDGKCNHIFLVPWADEYGLFSVGGEDGVNRWISDFDFVRIFMREDIVDGEKFPRAIYVERV